MHPLASPPRDNRRCCTEERGSLAQQVLANWRVWNVGDSELLEEREFLSVAYSTCLLFPGYRKYWEIFVE